MDGGRAAWDDLNRSVHPLLQGQDPVSVIRERLAWNGVALSFPCNLATRARVTLSALFAPAPA
jgi:hypothetical protein